MKWLCALILAALPHLSLAATVKVTSGEHDGFTRLVMEYGGPVDWVVGRTVDGYGLRLRGESPLYDLSAVFDIIGKSRLAAIWVDPETQMLRVGIACACHVIPFEFRPGIIVIDLKDGAPPKGSSFELALDGAAVKQLAPRPNPRPRTRPADTVRLVYDWTAPVPPDTPKPETVSRAPMAFETPDPATVDLTLQPLREQLLRQMSRGAAQGVIEMALPDDAIAARSSETFPSAQIRIGELPGISSGTGLPAHQGIAAAGQSCVGADSLAFETWGDARPMIEQMAEAMTNLTGEFDRPVAAAVEKAVRFNLFMGFGAEATQLLQAFPLEHTDVAVWKSLAHLIDDEPDPAPAFVGQANCDNAAAMWAILADPSPEDGAKRNAKAALLAFSALPLHLRRHLGARLADQFMALGEAESARAIRDAILRASGGPGVEVELLQARMEMDAGDPQAAETRASKMLADAGSSAGEALIAFTDARVAQVLPVEPSLVSALEAMVSEHSGTPDAPRYARALALAQAASGDFASALAGPEKSADTEILVWKLLAAIGEDDAVMNHAILSRTAALPAVGIETAALLGERLIGLGFPAQALQWLRPAENFDPVMVAQAHLRLHDAQSALDSLAQQTSPEALMMRGEALQMLGNEKSAAEIYVAAGDIAAGWRATGRAHDWPKLAEAGPEPWKHAAATTLAAGPAARPAPKASAGTTPVARDAAASAAAVAEEGPLARSRRLVDGSAATRAVLDTLLASLPIPQPGSE